MKVNSYNKVTAKPHQMTKSWLNGTCSLIKAVRNFNETKQRILTADTKDLEPQNQFLYTNIFSSKCPNNICEHFLHTQETYESSSEI